MLGLVVFAALAVPYTESQDSGDAAAEMELGDLQQRRIKLLEDRVSVLKSGFRPNGSELIPSRMDLLNARIEYARSTAERKMSLLTF